MVDRLADRWRELIDRRDELLRLGRVDTARRIDEAVVRIRRRVAFRLRRLPCRPESAAPRVA
jgi:hypothetical protein